ncbi:putative C6 transcription factor [Aspergillus filifer]
MDNPEANTLPTHPRRRGRIARACDACHSRKIKCDTAKPKCDWCAHHDSVCTYIKLEGPLEPILPGNSSRQAPSEVPSGRDGPVETFALAFAQNLQFAGRYLGHISTFDGASFFSKRGREWVYSCTGQVFQPDCPATTPSNGQFLPSQTVLADNPLPDLEFLYSELQHYSTSTFGSFFPILDLSLFGGTVNAAYYQRYSVSSPGTSSARACIFSLLALTALAVHGPRGLSLRYSDQYFREARRHLPGIFEEPASLDRLQALLLLCLCAQGLIGDFYAVDHLLSAASRVVLSLKAHLSPESAWESPTAIDYHARKLFWILYVCDKGLSLVTGLPPRLDDAQCDLDIAMNNCTRFGTQKSRVDTFPEVYLNRYIELALLQTKIQRELYSISAMRQSDAELIRKIRDLDHELEFWRESLDTTDQPCLSYRARDSLQYTDMRFSIFHLQYHHCMVMIHQASSRCASWIQNQNTQGASSSLAISVTASRSLLHQFQSSRLDLGPENLLFSISSFIQAIIVLFCNILSNPNDDYSKDDLELISSVPTLLEQHKAQDGPPCYSSRINAAAKIIVELERLAKCAIEKMSMSIQEEISTG